MCAPCLPPLARSLGEPGGPPGAPPATPTGAPPRLPPPAWTPPPTRLKNFAPRQLRFPYETLTEGGGRGARLLRAPRGRGGDERPVGWGWGRGGASERGFGGGRGREGAAGAGDRCRDTGGREGGVGRERVVGGVRGRVGAAGEGARCQVSGEREGGTWVETAMPPYSHHAEAYGIRITNVDGSPALRGNMDKSAALAVARLEVRLLSSLRPGHASRCPSPARIPRTSHQPCLQCESDLPTALSPGRHG